MNYLYRSRYSVFIAFISFFLLSSFIIRVILSILSSNQAGLNLLSYLKIFSTGVIFDLGVSLFFSIIYSFYLLFLPSKWLKTKFNYAATFGIIYLMVLISLFSFFAELTFWNEFESRFNFIAVDYLVYTYEVINNINESYPLPLLIGSVVLISLLVIFVFIKMKAFSISFNSQTLFRKCLASTGAIFLISVLYILFLKNNFAEKSSNRYQNELSKAGIYSFFAAFRDNELNYEHFYPLLDNGRAFKIIRKEFDGPGSKFIGGPESILRSVSATRQKQLPNVIMITIESFSADFMKHFGNTQNITPVLDSIADNGTLFTNMYATGTRTVRGMEALSLAIPPTPGNSIVRRPDNQNLSTVGHIFRQKGYVTSFFYGGDGYFDNMNQYFGSNGYNVIDRGRSVNLGDNYKAKHTIITDKEVNFENAWGISDGDLYSAVIKNSDENYKNGQRFYNFVMTTSNHRPFTFPAGKIDLKSGSGREGAVKYTDYAIGNFLNQIKGKPWFKNTVFIFVADHCASSAGKNEIDISKYNIPCIIYNLPAAKKQVINSLCSQIDIYPTLLHILGWKYESNLYGQNVLSTNYIPRVVLGTYQKLAYMKSDSLVILSPQRKVETYLYNKELNEQIPTKFPAHLIEQAISYYQTAYLLFKNGQLKSANRQQNAEK
ncbi:MAG: sulfatase-like hydrolase/transferase [Flavobacterium sp.]|nr:sulfatase-like hydrolase/transferase [Pedobacter sp.]